MVRPADPFWAHVEEVNGGLKNCKFCGHRFGVDTSISRIKWHLSGVRRHGVAICANVPKDVQEAAYLATEGANKRQRTMPGSGNSEVTNATSTSQQEQSNENANLASVLERTLMDDWCTEPEMGGNRDFAGAQAGKFIENITIETQQPIQTSIGFERLPVDEHETMGAAIQPTDELGCLFKKDWSEILASLMDLDFNINETNNTIATSLQGQNNLVENIAVDVEMQQEYQPMELETQHKHPPLLDIFYKTDIHVEAALWPLFEKLMSLDLVKSAHKEKVDGELKKWESKLLQIHAVLNDAEEKQVTDLAVKNWLSNVRDLIYDVEDILDGFQTETLMSKLNRAESQAGTSTATQWLLTSCADPQPSSVSRDMVAQSKLKNISKRLEELVKEKNELCLQTNVRRRSSRANNRVPTTSLVKEPNVYGREQVREDLVELLLTGDASSSRDSVIPIVGMGGIGKTTLAQLAYNDERLKFDYKAWVCVSDEFDVTRITKTILLQLGGNEANDLNVLQHRLNDKLQGQKFFIVLDDIWPHEYDDWTTLCSPFAAGAPGSKILITTRTKEVSSRISTTSSFELKELPYGECLCLFAQHAIDAENFDAHPDLREVGQKIVQRCKGLPLAAKTLGGLLRHSQHVQEWEEILNSEIWHLPEEKSGILSALRLSYHHLPSHLKQCFAYCAFFPKDYEFDKDELVLLWMAEGFLQQPGKKQQEKDTGQKYFHDLLSRCFFQESSSNKLRYVMHDLLSDLAQFVSGETCFQLDDKGTGAKSCAKVRHSSFIIGVFDTWKRFEGFCEMKSLRTFIALASSTSSGGNLSSKVLDDLVPKLKCLRSLSLAYYYSVKDLPNSIGALKHLRYLNLSRTNIKRLPESLGELLNLQTLKLCGCIELVELPACIGNLINLQCLDVGDTYSLQKMPPDIGKLKNLITLSKFIVGEDGGLGIGELKNLPHLKGKLHIIGLRKTSKIHKAKCFNLKEKHGLDELDLEWSDDFDDARNESHEWQVLNLLQPHQSLEKLSITLYGGTEFPPWVGDPSFAKLVDLRLFTCFRITSLLSLGKLPALRNLKLQGMNKVKEVVVEGFLCLETLIIEDMAGWERWSNGVNDVTKKFPKLCELKLSNCPRLVGNWPSCLPSLSKLEISNCPQLADLPEALPSVYELNVACCQEAILSSVHCFTSLTKLKISDISGLVSLHERVVQALVALEDLEINHCNELMYLWEDDGNGLGKLANLKSLRVEGCDQLVLLAKGVCSSINLRTGESSGLECLHETAVQASVALEDLSVTSCNELKYLWEDGNALGKLTNLKSLYVFHCDKLESLVKGEEGMLPCNLQVLSVNQCDNLEKLPNGLYSLRELKISGCQKIVSIPEGARLPFCLRSLKIGNCKSLESVPDGMMTTTMNGNQQCILEELIIQACPSLKYFPRGRGRRLPTMLKQLSMDGCGGEFPEVIFHCDESDMSHHSHLEDLSVYNFSLASFPTGFEFPTSLKKLYFAHCKISSFPSLHALSHLTQLTVSSFDELELFPEGGLPLPHLIQFHLENCEKLRCLPNHMEYLTSLQDLSLRYCSSLESFPERGLPTNLFHLDILSCEKLTQQPLSDWGLDMLTSLKRLTVDFARGGGGDVDCCFPDDDALLLPTSITSLEICNHEYLESISRGIQHLSSLKYLAIENCPNLESLPKEGFPPTLGSLEIWGCPLLEDRCLKERGDYWPIIAQIPYVDI